MKIKAKALEDAIMGQASAESALTAAVLNRSIMRHSLTEAYRAQAVAASEKITEKRLEDKAVSDSQYAAKCQEEVLAILAAGEAKAKVAKAKCDYEIAVIEAK